MKKSKKGWKEAFKPVVYDSEGLDDGTVVPVHKLSLRKQVEYWRAQVHSLQDANSLQNIEARTQREEIEQLKLRSARYERIIDRLTGVRE